MTTTPTTTWVDGQGFTWTTAEWTEHAQAEGVTWHVRLDGLAIIEGETWAGGDTLLSRIPDDVAEMAAAIRREDDGAGLTGTSDARIVAEEWVSEGFSTTDAKAWWDARGFDPRSCALLRDDGITPEQASERIDVAGYEDTIAYAVSNGDLGVGAAVDMVSGQ